MTLQHLHDSITNDMRYEKTTSEKFTPIQTSQAIAEIENLGWKPVNAWQTKTRDESRRAYARHSITFRREGDLNLKDGSHNTGDIVPQFTLLNANDGTSSEQFLAGFLRIQCLNGLMMGTSFEASRIRHSTGGEKLAHLVKDAIAGVDEHLRKGSSLVKEWKEIQLTDSQIRSFASQAVLKRFPGTFEEETLTIERKGIVGSFGSDFLRMEFSQRVASVLQANRQEDWGGDLWRVFNRIQENTIRGGFVLNSPRVTDKKGGGATLSQRKTKPLNNPYQTTALNRALWDIGEGIARGETFALPEHLIA